MDFFFLIILLDEDARANKFLRAGFPVLHFAVCRLVKGEDGQPLHHEVSVVVILDLAWDMMG